MAYLFQSVDIHLVRHFPITVEQTTGTTEKRVCHWKKMVLMFYLLLTFLFFIFLASIIYIYYSNISNQLTELKKNASEVQNSIMEERETLKENLMKINETLASQVQDSIKKERETWKENFLRMNQTLVNELAVLKSDVKTLKKILGLCTSCPAGWSLLGSSCYFLSASHQTWKNSQKECSKMDSLLLVLKDKMELDAVRQLTGNKRFWIGLKRGNLNTWLWVDGTIAVYTNWNSGEPNNFAQREHCTEMITGIWNDLDCDKTIDYICQKPATCL
ncbi:hepatic lectin-like [Anomaloglossus baeobatrachus]